MRHILDEINNPSDVKKLNIDELTEVAKEIRDFLLENLAKTGGHLASNLGVVELTLALHKTFDLPNDKIIWDVGHQAYVHKILTGRREAFSTLRQTDGLSGFPKRFESEYDVYDTGHSSTSLSAALGMATARDMRGDKREIIAVIGDGSLTGGPAFEAINSIGQSGTKVIIILNDNGMSISKNIGGLSEHLGKLRTSTKYIDAKERLKDALDKVPGVGRNIKRALGGTKERIKYAIINDGVLFEELGLTYLGPVDGHDIEDLLSGLNFAKKADGPVILHVITQKGKGYTPAELHPDRFHGVGPFDVETGRILSANKATYSDLFGDAIYELSKTNDRITAISAAMTEATGLGLMKDRIGNRVFDVGIAESNAVIMAAGQALSGMHPVVAIYSSFLQRAYDEILEDVCMQNLPVTFAVDRAGLVGADGETHQGIFDLSYFLTMPNLKIFAPCDGVQLAEMLEYAVKIDTPTAIRYPKGTAITRSLTGEKFTGKNILVKNGNDIMILAVGTMLSTTLETAAILERDGLSVGVINIGVVNDYGKENIRGLKDVSLAVTVEDNIASGGFGEHFRATNPDMRTISISWPNKFIEQGDPKDIFARYDMDAIGIAKQIREKLVNTEHQN